MEAVKAAKLSSEQLQQMGARIRALRESRGLGQREVGKELEYEEATGYWRVEKGESEIPLAKLVRLIEMLDTSLDYIVRGAVPFDPELNAEQRAALYREMRTPQEHRERIERHVADAPHQRVTQLYVRGFLNALPRGEDAAADAAVNVTALHDLAAQGGRLIDPDAPPPTPPPTPPQPSPVAARRSKKRGRR